MSPFCTSCGFSLTPGKGFCPQCGSASPSVPAFIPVPPPSPDPSTDSVLTIDWGDLSADFFSAPLEAARPLNVVVDTDASLTPAGEERLIAGPLLDSCQACGAQVEPDIAFCRECGAPFHQPAPASLEQTAVRPRITPAARRPAWRLPIILATVVVILAAAGVGAYLSISHLDANSAKKRGSSAGASWLALGQNPTDADLSGLPPDAVVFRSVTGAYRAYVPAGLPASTSWVRYASPTDGYQVELPGGWDLTKTSAGGHEDLDLYPRGRDTSVNRPGGPQGIHLKWAADFQMPAADDADLAGLRTITVEGTAGHVFTLSAMGSVMTAVFPWNGGYLVLEADAEQETTIEIFQHMLGSLHLG